MSWSHPGKTAAAGGVAALVAFAAAGGPPAALHFTNAPVQVQAGQCSPPLTVELLDNGGATAIAPADTAVDLTQPDSALLFTSASCTGIMNQATIAAGTSTVSFAVYGTRAGSYPAIASSPGLAGATQDVTIRPAPPVQAEFVTPPLSLDPNTCSPALTVRLEDQYFNASPTGAPLSLSIAVAPSTTAKAYSDPACQTEIQALVFSASSSLASFYLKDPLPEAFNVGVSNGSIVAGQSELIRPGELPLQLELAGEDVFLGSELKLRAVISYPGPGTAGNVALMLGVEGATRVQPIPFNLLTIGSGSSAQLQEPLIVNVTAGQDVVAHGRVVLYPYATQVGPEVTVTRTAGHMIEDLGGGCACTTAGGANAVLAAVALALLRGSRRRSPCSR